MKIPPIEWDDLVSLGMESSALVMSDGTTSPKQSKLICELLIAMIANPSPDPYSNRSGYLRHIRDTLLRFTDWTQMSDSPLNTEQRSEWAVYRQQLRDLPLQYSGEGSIPWPQTPTIG
jgi:hypothetical protein